MFFYQGQDVLAHLELIDAPEMKSDDNGKMQAEQFWPNFHKALAHMKDEKQIISILGLATFYIMSRVCWFVCVYEREQ